MSETTETFVGKHLILAEEITVSPEEVSPGPIVKAPVKRDSRGKFVKGVSGNPSGRPSKAAKLSQQLERVLTLREWRAICIKAIKDAKRGDRFARAWLSEYVMGTPTRKVDITTAGQSLNKKLYSVVSPDDWDDEIVEGEIVRQELDAEIETP